MAILYCKSWSRNDTLPAWMRKRVNIHNVWRRHWNESAHNKTVSRPPSLPHSNTGPESAAAPGGTMYAIPDEVSIIFSKKTFRFISPVSPEPSNFKMWSCDFNETNITQIFKANPDFFCCSRALFSETQCIHYHYMTMLLKLLIKMLVLILCQGSLCF